MSSRLSSERIALVMSKDRQDVNCSDLKLNTPLPGAGASGHMQPFLEEVPASTLTTIRIQDSAAALAVMGLGQSTKYVSA